MNILQGIHRTKFSVQTVLPKNAKSKCVLLNEKLQEFVINYQMACSGTLYSGRILDYTNNCIIFVNQEMYACILILSSQDLTGLLIYLNLTAGNDC